LRGKEGEIKFKGKRGEVDGGLQECNGEEKKDKAVKPFCVLVTRIGSP